ncbi:MAG: chemotaxis protein CheC, partial [Firmicutes bacterium]|nr:chemotaxis protein CheC [Bacillota bacterium]
HLEMDALKEVGTIGAGNAATVLASMLGQKIPMTVPEAKFLPLSDVVEALGGPEREVVGILLGVSGPAPGTIIFVLSLADAEKLAGKLMGMTSETPGRLSEMQKSALSEVTNILAGGYLNALGQFTSLVFEPTPPAFAHDMAGALLDSVLADLGRVSDYALFIETNFTADEDGLSGHFFLIPSPEGLERILQALGVRQDWEQREN